MQTIDHDILLQITLDKTNAEYKKIIESVKDFCEGQTDDCGKCKYIEDNICNTYDADFCRGKTSAMQDILTIIEGRE